MRFLLLYFALALSAALSQRAVAQSSSRPPRPKPAAHYTYKVVHVYPHDPEAFTQGLVYHDGFLYESTGLNGRSSVRKVRLETGEVLEHTDLVSDYFGEGIAILNNQVFQLTWRSQTGFVYKLSDFSFVRRFSYAGEGWGLTTDGRDLYMSDGSAEIRVIDPAGFREKRRIKVHDRNTPITQLNELEWVEGEIFANVWQTDRIARISPTTGRVTGWIDLKGLLSPVYKLEEGAVLNGIAYDAKGKRLFATGKLWPKLFEIQLVLKPGQ